MRKMSRILGKITNIDKKKKKGGEWKSCPRGIVRLATALPLAENHKLQLVCPWDNPVSFLNSDTATIQYKDDE